MEDKDLQDQSVARAYAGAFPDGCFRYDYDGVQFWSNTSDHCAVPGCMGAGVAIPVGLGFE